MPARKKPKRPYYGGGRENTHGEKVTYRLTLEETEDLKALAATLALSLYETTALLVREGLQRRKDEQGC